MTHFQETDNLDIELEEEDLWSDRDWESLLLAIQLKLCTPFLGAGACAGVLPLGGQVASRWSDEYDYPFDDRASLPRVSQYVAIDRGAQTPRFKLVADFNRTIAPLRKQGFPHLRRPSDPHRVVADLELPLYITTNYDDFMLQALRLNPPLSFPVREPMREVCDWRMSRQRGRISAASQRSLPEPSPENPIVYHLHGWLDDPDSLVLTEDDYLDFLVYISENPDLIWARLEEAFASSSLLFLGYSLDDLNFKVLLRQLANYMQRSEGARHVAVQLAPQGDETDEQMKRRAERQRIYLEEKYKIQKVKVYWGTCERFAAELRRKWEQAQ
ncbi:MAG TPA: SIR2 family protein [Longimicrobium sp.]|nr:SIR2 family protein [Longimicrobium sp.]